MPKRKLQMRFRIEHELKGRMRLHVCTKKMSYEEADTLQYYLGSFPFVTKVKVHENIGNVTVNYVGSRKQLCEVLAAYQPETVDVPDEFLHNSGRKLNEEYKEKLINKVLFMAGTKLFLPAPGRTVITVIKAGKYWKEGIKTLAHRKIEVPVLDATAIGVSVFRQDLNSANSIMFLLGIGEILEEWTHKKSVEDLARSMSLNITKVWQLVNGKEVLVPSNAIVPGDEVVVHMGNVIPFDGVLTSGDAMVNQASLTGEPLPVHKTTGGYVYAGTVVEDGDLTLKVEKSAGGTRFEKVVAMIEDSEKLKSSLEGKAEHLADRLVPYTLAGTGAVYLLTRNVTKTLAVLMVDFSCALKLAMPISVLSAIREASHYQVTVKGGKYLEAMSEADTIVFDKTGTLTKAQPTVVDVIPFCEAQSDELLRIAACLEEHFPHSMAKAVVDAAAQKGLVHEEIHSKVEYIVAHGISSFVEGKKVVIGSAHFIFEDEKCVVPEGYQSRFDSLPEEYSHLYLAVDGKLCAVICIEDPLREEAAEVIQELKKVGIKNVVMMTGDSNRTARAIAARVGVDRYFAEVLPEDKAHFVEKAKANGSKVIMIGDGINDSPALSAADVGIAISDGAEIAREIADVTVGADNLYQIVTLKQISNALMKRIHTNYRRIVAINAGLIVLGVAGVIQPTTSALLHNSSTLVISLESMKNLLEG